MKSPQYRDRADGGTGEIGRDVLSDGREPQNVYVQHFAGAMCGFEIFPAEMSQTKVQAVSGGRLLDDISVTFELVADRRPDEIGPVRIEPFLHHQVDLTEIDIAKVDRDFLGVGHSWARLRHVTGHNVNPILPSIWMLYGWYMDVFSPLSRGERIKARKRAGASLPSGKISRKRISLTQCVKQRAGRDRWLGCPSRERRHLDRPGETIVVVDTGTDQNLQKADRVEVDKNQQTVKLLDNSNDLIGFYPATVGSQEKPSPLRYLEGDGD